jgi:alanine dehydrogenase
LCNVTLPWVLQLANHGIELAIASIKPIASAANIVHGKITNAAVAETFSMEHVPLAKLQLGGDTYRI